MWNRFNKVVILKILVAPLLVFSVASVPAQGIEDAWKSSFDAGETALNKGALREAEQKFRFPWKMPLAIYEPRMGLSESMQDASI